MSTCECENVCWDCGCVAVDWTLAWAVSGETGICLKTTYCVHSVCSGDAANHKGASDLQGNASQDYTNMNRLAVCHISVTSAALCKCELHGSYLHSQHNPQLAADVKLQQYCFTVRQIFLSYLYKLPLCKVDSLKE